MQSRSPQLVSRPDRRAVRDFLAATGSGACSRKGTLAEEPVAEVAATVDATIVGYAQAVAEGDGYTVDCAEGDPATRRQLVSALVGALPASAVITWWGHDLADDLAVAAALGMPPPHRRLLNMRRPLPLDASHHPLEQLELRHFRVGVDESAWLDVNNAAFGWHAEQGDWNREVLRVRTAEPWFDPAGFLLHHRGGRLAAFCWTKVHDGGVGEIYVIAVHPDFHGLGLGRAMTIAGLRHLADTGSTEAMLYVEADNVAAVHLYESLGFVTTHTDLAFRRPPVATSSGEES